ncbi:Lrp/AsnC ligand binding domain-containing protein [Actinoplanes sp. L3-i22]|uniref:Lrp/AsnC ligand binding domain-containing protein n=1 Tax=Actinoplanes sp. L3-i22 TaxID=2836373 RepID=UPI00351CB866
MGYASAVTGPADVVASVVCRNLDDLYDYLATGVGSLDGISHADTSPVVRRVKAAGLRIL